MDSTSTAPSRRGWGVSLTRWVAILLLLHPLSLGPLLYLDGRGWVSLGSSQIVYVVFYWPEIYVLMHDVPFLDAPSEAYRGYVSWWQDLGKAHTSSAPAATPVPSVPPPSP